MDLDISQIARKKRVGTLKNGQPVVEVMTKGGFHLILTTKNGRAETLGVGSHRAVARHIAGQKEDINWSELSKSDYIAPEHFQDILPKFVELTDRLRKAQGW